MGRTPRHKNRAVATLTLVNGPQNEICSALAHRDSLADWGLSLGGENTKRHRVASTANIE